MFAGARSGLNARLSVSTGGQGSGLTGLCGEYGRALTAFQRQGMMAPLTGAMCADLAAPP